MDAKSYQENAQFIFRNNEGTIDPGNAMASARNALNEGDFNLAEKSCLAVLEANSEHGGALLVLGTVYSQTARLDEGIDTFRKLVSIQPRCVPALNWLAALLRETGNLAEAVSLARKAVEHRPDDPESHYNLGLCLKAALQHAKAARSFEQATLLGGSVPMYRRELVAMLQRLGRDLDAERAIDEGLANPPGDPALDAYRAQILVKREGQAAARQYCENVHTSDPARKIQTARALSALGHWELAENVLRTVIGEFPKLAAAHASLGEVLQHFGRFEEASDCLRQSIALDPTSVAPYFNLVHRGRVTDGDRPLLLTMETMANRAAKSWEERRTLRYGLGKAYDDLGEYGRAIEHFDEANRIAYDQTLRRGPFRRERFASHVDRQIGIFTKEFLDRHRGLGNPSDLPIFIVGMMRSGTTLVRQIVSSHPQVGAGGEIQFWAESGRVCLDSEGRSLLPERVQALAEEYLAILRDIAPRRIRVTDKMPHNYLVLGRIHAAFPNARIIHCRRHPVDTCLSIWVTPFQHPAGYTYDRDNIVFAYRQYERLMEHWRSVLPQDRFTEIDYEELVAQPELNVRRLVEFCGLPWDDACLKHHENKAVVKTASVWQARQPLYDSSIGRWRHYEPWLGPFRELLSEDEAGDRPVEAAFAATSTGGWPTPIRNTSPLFWS